ncbi:hypothetical protein CBR_g88573 [Chara braunii]|uniref:Pectate lyase n=1 Tax=Chara braunii TaxID=69332 RepID=A0A388KB46_CHABU|nr:hypothetical protein CBR_g88573 [Chara braunii]|eukprot:GBG67285.1 hypothetical protein CBR_g88573 [Chara braunii]
MACNYAREPPYEFCDYTLRSLACSAQGFGRGAIGGRDGEVFHVTTLAADGPGSLAEACNKTCPLWIVFEVSGTIELSKYIRVRSFKTIDGRGQRIKIHGHGLQLKECEHVIICNIELERGPDDGIQLKPNTRNIWIDRCTLSDYDDGLIDVTRASTDVTISRCRFANHNKTMLLSADPTHTFDRVMRVTIHHCFFDNTRQRHPRVRFGKAHLYNNYTRGWGVYAVCSAVEAEIMSIAGRQNITLPPDCQAGAAAAGVASWGPPPQILSPAMPPAYAHGPQHHYPPDNEQGEGDHKKRTHLGQLWSYVTATSKKYFDK